MKTIKDLQRDMLTYIRDYIRENGYPPTIREMQVAVGLSGPSHVHYHLSNLERLGYIRRTPDASRGIEVVADAETRRFPALLNIPIMGTIAAGEPIHAAQEVEYMTMSRDAVAGGDFALRVKGHSMVEDHIEDGDLVIVRRQETADNGDTVVALVLNGTDDEQGAATLKRLYREPPRTPADEGRIRLQPRNAALTPIYVPPECLRIQGKVVAVYRQIGSG